MAAVNQNDLLLVGLQSIGYDITKINNVRQEKNEDRFRAAYGASPLVLSIIFNELQTRDIGEATIDKPKVKNFLMAMHWLKRYPVETIMSATFNQHEETIRRKVFEFVEAIQALKVYKIAWQDNINNKNNNQQVGIASWLLSVDGTHCKIKEPRSRPDKDWYSHKHHKPCVAYELGVNLFESKLVWVNRPFKAGETDIVIFRKPDGLKSKLPENSFVIGDKGYAGDTSASIPNRQDDEEVNIFKRRARARHEDFNGRIKNFAVLSERFRHSVLKHKAVFEAVCVVTQYSMENGHPLFDV